MKNLEEVYGELTPLFQELFEDDTIVLHPDTTAEDIRGWDSFNNITLMVAIERQFRMRMTTAEIESFSCVGDMAAAIIRKQSS
jgi:acyl carrier protein